MSSCLMLPTAFFLPLRVLLLSETYLNKNFMITL